MLAICTDDQEVEISGSADELRNVRVAIVGLLSSPDFSASLPAAHLDPSPYSRALPELTIQRASGPTLVTTTQSSLVVSSSDDSLARFSTWFNFPADARPGHHAHFEPMPGDPYHSPESIPLAITIRHAGA